MLETELKKVDISEKMKEYFEKQLEEKKEELEKTKEEANMLVVKLEQDNQREK